MEELINLNNFINLLIFLIVKSAFIQIISCLQVLLTKDRCAKTVSGAISTNSNVVDCKVLLQVL